MNKSTRERLFASTLLAGVASLGVPMAVGTVALTAATDALAQSYTSVDFAGTVTDANGDPVSGATITAVSTQGVSRTAVTNADGSFRFSAVPGGRYSVSVSAAGYSSVSDRTVVVSPGASTFNFALSEAGGEDIVVTATRSAGLDVTDVGTAFNVQELSNRVPLGRSINSAVLLTPSAGLADPSIAANGVRRNQSAVSLAGTSAAESVYYINGLNVTDQRTFLGYADLPFEFIESIQTKTNGYSAEYGRGTGGIVNIVTRSGSNEFHFGASASWSPEDLREDRGESWAPGGNNSVGQNVYNQYASADSHEYTLWASGPIIRDHLFAFGIYNAREFDNWGAQGFTNTTTANGTWTNTTADDPRWGIKLDFVINPDHRIEATIFNDEETTHYQPWNVNRSHDITATSATNPDGSLLSYDQESGGQTEIIQYTGNITDWFTVSLLYGHNESNYVDSGPYISQPGILDFGALGGGYATLGRQAGPFNLEGQDERDTYRADFDFYFNAAGDHHLRIGYDREDLTSTAESFYTGGALYYAFAQQDCADLDSSGTVGNIPAEAGPDGCVELLTFGNSGSFEARQTAVYLTDAWEITPNLTLNLGVRQDIYDYLNASGESYIKIDDQYSPRLGFAWTPSDTTRITGSYGHYYLPIATNTSIRASSGEIYTDEYFQTDRTSTCVTSGACGDLVIDANGYPTVGTQIGTTDYFSPPGGPDPSSVAEQDLQPMYESGIALGIEHDFTSGMLDGWTMGVQLVHRELQSTIEDTAIGDAIVRYCARTSAPTLCSGASSPVPASYYPYVLINPGDGATVFLDPEGDPRTLGPGVPNPAFNLEQYDLTAADLALPDAERRYDAITLTLERPFDGTWGINAAYTYAQSRGNYEGAVKSDIGQTDTSITQDFDHAINMVGAYGDLPNDHRHTLRVFGSWSPFDRLTIGANTLFQSGRPYGCIGYGQGVNVDPSVPNSGTPGAWSCPNGALTATAVSSSSIANQLLAAGVPAGELFTRDRNLVGRGNAGHTDFVTQLDLHFSYRFLGEEDGGDMGRLIGTMDIFNVFDGDAVTRVVEQGEVRTSASGQKGVAAPFYGLPRTYQAPRTIRFGLRYEF